MGIPFLPCPHPARFSSSVLRAINNYVWRGRVGGRSGTEHRRGGKSGERAWEERSHRAVQQGLRTRAASGRQLTTVRHGSRRLLRIHIGARF